ncbi:Ig-like domain-containing protein [Haloplasma contractile]|uniref:Ig domain-containing protein group 2 domain-containing protein n=1 Tax=Haloplasma contractile SSD-17B TaxID=1033810 RepID=U2EGS1_9MOLU|nr:Ig-like domain-containing protein [Haloplasma contractile]ERJ13811.1 Ig domain-containing protein group 2 domain-containing protein [Haloplasma contractile SSD-17B]
MNHFKKLCYLFIVVIISYIGSMIAFSHQADASTFTDQTFSEYAYQVESQMSDYLTYQDEYYTNMTGLINTKLSTNYTTTDLKNAVNNELQFNILEITPEVYDQDPFIEVSDVYSSLNRLTSLYQDMTVTYDLQGDHFIQNMGNFNLEVMTIKQFVANRQDIEGKYDAIIFTTGDYTPKNVEECPKWESYCDPYLDTTDNLNDLTVLKANQLIEQYMNKGVPVFIHSNAFNYPDSILYEKLKGSDLTYGNVFEVSYNNTDDLYQDVLAYMAYIQINNMKPEFELTKQPVDYLLDSTKTYNQGDLVEFEVNLTNYSQAKLSFYIDFTGDYTFSNDERIYSSDIVNGTNSFSFYVPELYSGVFDWKVMIEHNGVTATKSGLIKFGGHTKEIKVLNVVSSMVEYRNNLLEDEFVDAYFNNNGEYKITVESCTIKEFSKNSKNESKHPCSHYRIMDEYDVILLGQDIFDDHPNRQVFNSIQQKIDEGKPIIFTSAMTRGHKFWLDYFSGFLFTNFQIHFSESSENVNNLEIVNYNSYSSYPFNINSEELLIPSDLNYSYNEQYQLDLEDPNLIPLMNMYNKELNRKDQFDSYNNIYYAKRNNLTFLNIGNNSYRMYKDIEHKLLANAIVNTYLTTEKQIPEVVVEETLNINVTNTFENALINETDAINFNFTPTTTNTNTTYQYKVFVNEQQVEEGTSLGNEQQTITLNQLANPTANSVDSVYVRVVVSDEEQKNESVYGFNLFVADIDDYFEMNRNLDSTPHQFKDYIQVNNTKIIDYDFNVKALDFSNIASQEQLPTEIILKNISFKEQFPVGIEITSIPSGFTKTGDYLTGTTIEHTFNDIQLILINGEYIVLNPDYKFDISFRALETNTFTLNQSTLRFNAIQNQTVSQSFNHINFEASKTISSHTIIDHYTDYLFVPYNSSIDMSSLFTVDQDVVLKDIYYNLGTVLNSYNNQTPFEINDRMLYSKAIGEQIVEITFVDVFGYQVTKQIPIYTYETISELSIYDIGLNLLETKSLTINMNPILSLNNLTYSVKDPTVVDLYSDNGQLYVTGLKEGKTSVTISGYNKEGKLIESTASITVNNPTYLSVSPDITTLYVSQQFSDYQVTCNYTGDYRIEFRSLNQSVATITQSTGIVSALAPGSATIEIELYDQATNVLVEKISTVIIVKDVINDQSGFTQNEYEFKTTESVTLEDLVKVEPSTIEDEVILEFNVIDSDQVVLFDQTQGIITPLKAGTIQLEVILSHYDEHLNLLNTVSDSVQIVFVTPTDPINDDGEKY